MAISIASTLTSRLWKGEPKVVIRGKFSLGLVSSSNRYSPASFLYLAGLAANPGSTGETFSVQVEGRQSYYASSYDSWVFDEGMHYLMPWNYFVSDVFYDPDLDEQGKSPVTRPYPVAYSSGGKATSPGLYPGLVTMATACNGHWNDSSEANIIARSGGFVGSIVSNDVKITIRGVVKNLDLTKISAAGFVYEYDSSHPSPANILTTTRTTVTVDGVSQNAGWHPLEAHIYDNQWLRADGHLTAGDVPVFWE